MSRQARFNRESRAELSDVGVIPAVVNIARRKACEFDLEKFLVEYFPESTGLSPFSEDHKRVIKRIESCVLRGGRYANVVYRGFAKTTITENAALWATLYGHRKFVAIFGADATAASGNVDSIKRELSDNELLFEDFPEVCHPIVELDGKPQRCSSQMHVPGNVEGFEPSEETEPERTHIKWTSDKIVLPTITLPDGQSKSSSAVISCNGLAGSNRGMKHKRPDGTQQRPDFVLLDDPQTDESAATELQVRKRFGIIKKAILKLGGHNKQLAVVMNATPIQPDDLVEQILDPAKNHSWQSERIAMVRSWAAPAVHESLWLGEYRMLRETYDKDVLGDQQRAHAEATEFYRSRRDEMDAGCVVSWEHCYDHEAEISAIQHAYNALIDDGEEVFQSECQCRPIKQALGEADEVTVSSIANKLNKLQRGIVPLNANRLTMFIDVQQNLLFYCVCAWADDFTGAVIEYGAFPDQKRAQFTLKDARITLGKKFPNAGIEGAIYGGLMELTDKFLSRDWRREDGVLMRIDRCLVDSGYQPEVIHEVCRRSPFAGVMTASKGFAITAAKLPFSEWKQKPGEKLRDNWALSPAGNGRRLAKYDTNYWKSFTFSRLATSMGDRGCLSLFGTSAEAHAVFAAHLTAEYRVRTKGRGREIDEWQHRPSKPDNHWLDCLVGCAVGASMQGCAFIGESKGATGPRKARVPLAQMGRK